jgi:aminoglycoside 3-N-acetyltransferase
MTDGLTKREIQSELENVLGLDGNTDVIAHVNLEALGPVQGGAETVIAAILAASGTVVMPAFTYQTQIIPQDGPPDNAIAYGTGDEMNARAEFYRPDLRIHPDCGVAAETLRRENDTLRSIHPILSFIAQGPNARSVLGSQTRQNPLGPIAWLEAHDGGVLLMGVDQRHNFSLHLAEQRAGRKSFVRWALTMNDIEELPNIPGCSEGFNVIWQHLYPFTSVAQIGLARCELIPIKPMLELAEQMLRENPNFMLCNKPSCLSCQERETH